MLLCASLLAFALAAVDDPSPPSSPPPAAPPPSSPPTPAPAPAEPAETAAPPPAPAGATVAAPAPAAATTTTATATATATAAPAECAIAVLDFDAKKSAPETAKVLSDALAVELATRTSCKVVTMADIRSMTEFNALKATAGCEDASCLAEIGGALGVQRVVSGEITVLGKEQFVINARISNVADAMVGGRANFTAEKNAEAARKAAPRVAALLLGQPPPPEEEPPGSPLLGLVVTGSGVAVGAIGGILVALGESTLADGDKLRADKNGALLFSRLGLAGVGVVAAGVGAVLLVGGGA